ncbi:MAG: hypothetical protein KGH75_09910, partial [Rhodospirillales bacterium]|nr:hypothetical protein [Rhodospirillales bacterium]
MASSKKYLNTNSKNLCLSPGAERIVKCMTPEWQAIDDPTIVPSLKTYFAELQYLDLIETRYDTSMKCWVCKLSKNGIN